MLGTARRLQQVFGGEPPGQWVLLGFLVLITTLVEAAAAGLVFVLLDILATGVTTVPVLGEMSVENGGLLPLTVSVPCLFLVRAALVLGQDVLLTRSCYGAGARVEERLLKAYLTLPPRELRRRGTAELVRNVHDTVMIVVEGALIPLVMSVGLGLRVVSIGAVMLWAAPLPSLLAGAVFAPALWLLAHVLARPVRRCGAEVECALGESLKVANETLALASELRMAGRADEFSARFGHVRHRLARAAAVDEVLGVLPRLVAETLLVLFVAAYVAVSVVRGDAGAALPTLGLFAYSALRLLPSVVGIVGLVQSVRHTGPALDTLVRHQPLLAGVPVRHATVARPPAPERITVCGVTVAYEHASEPALDSVDLELRRGEIVAVVGDNGSGKSTLVDVLTGQVVPSSGCVLVDDTPIEQLDSSWVEHVGLVSQHVQLLDADLVTNVTLALTPSGDDEVAARSVLRLVGASELDLRLGQEGTALGEDGRSLSGGERQKVSLARALYRDVSLLVIDEGTSALDAEARAALLSVLSRSSQDRITVVVTHDPIVAAACSRVLRLDGGRLESDWRAPTAAAETPA